MKIVMTNHEVAQKWASQEQDEGRSHNSNMRFYGSEIYSWNQMIGKIIESKNGKVALTTARTWSVTTSKHTNLINMALWRSNIGTSFEVQIVNPNSHREHKINWDYLIDQSLDHWGKARRAREYTRYHIESAQEFTLIANAYRSIFKVRVPVKEYAGDLEQLVAKAEKHLGVYGHLMEEVAT